MSIAKQEFTNAGKSMLGRAQNGESLFITKIVVGDGAAAQPSDLWPLTALVSFKLNVVISVKTDYGDGTLLVEGSLRSDQATTAFYLKEVGVMAHIGAEADRLYSVANVFAGPPDYIDPAAPTIQTFKIKLIIDRIPTASLNVSIGPSENVIGANLGLATDGPGVYKDAAGNVLHFLRLVEGAAMDLHYVPDDVNPTGIYIGVSTLKQDLDLYVPMNYVGAPPGSMYFPTIQAAHDYLRGFVIPTDKYATIHVDAGTFHHSGILFNHPNSKQITLIGRPKVVKTIAALNGVGPNYTTKNISFPAGTDLSDLHVGQVVYIVGTQTGWTGGCKITAKAGAIITCDVAERFPCNRPAYNVASTGGSLRYYPTVVWWDNPQPGVRAAAGNMEFPFGIRTIENILAVDGFTMIRIAGVGQASMVRNCMCHGNGTGVHAFSGEGDLWMQGENISTDVEWGVDGGGDVVHLGDNSQYYANGCAVALAPAGNFAFAGINSGYVQSWVYINKCQAAARVWTGRLHIGHVIYQNCDVGFDCSGATAIGIGPLIGWGINNRLDLWAHGMGYIDAVYYSTYAPTCSPPDGQTGNSNSWIDIRSGMSREVEEMIEKGFLF